MNRLTKTSEVGKQQLLLAHGALDTKIGDKYLEYDGIDLAEFPYAVSTNILSPEYLEWGTQQMHLTLDKIAKANQSQKWDTGWSDITNVIDLPRWLQADI